MSAIKTFSQALPILADHGLVPVPVGSKLWRVGPINYDKGGIILLARKYEQEASVVTNQAYTFDQAASALRSLGYSVKLHGARYLVAYGDATPTPMRESELISLASGLSGAEAAPAWTATCGSCGQQFISDSPVQDGAICPQCAPSQALTVTNGVIVGVAMMDQAEARAVVTRIKGRIEEARRDLLDLHDREGWKALGYSSWGACAKAEFGGSAATLYRQLEAAEIERDVRADSQVENLTPLPTAQLQAVKALAPEQRKAAFERADELAGAQPRTAAHVAQAAMEAMEAMELNQAFWQALSANHPTAHLWTKIGHNEYRAACGMTAHHILGSTTGGHCSRCDAAAARPVAPAQPATKRSGILTSHQVATTDLDTPLRAQMEHAGYTWQSAAQTPDGRWHHLIRSRDTNLQRWQQIRLRRERIVLLLTPDLADILLRLDAHGYAKTATRTKGMTTFYSFRDYRSTLADGQAGELELAEGELPLWLAELDTNAAYAQAKQEKYQDARARAERLGYDLKRDGSVFVLTPAGKQVPSLRGALDHIVKAIDGYEKNAAKAASVPTRLACPTCHESILNGVWGDRQECGACYHVRQRAQPAPSLAQLNAQLPKALEKAGYSWVSDSPPIIGNNDGWRGDAREAESALSLAADREKARAVGFDANAVARLSYKLGATADRAEAISIWREIGSLLGVASAPVVEQQMDMPPFATPLGPIGAELVKLQEWAEIVGACHETELHAKLAELAALRRRLDLLSDAPDVFDDDYEELSGALGELEAGLKGWMESEASV